MERRDIIEIICGAIAIAAAIGEMFVNGISASTVLGAVKDIFGTIAIIILFFTVIWDKLPKHYSDFNKLFDEKMKDIISKYAPVVEKDSSQPCRYNIDSNFAKSICGDKVGTMRTFFEHTDSSMTFSVKKEFFMGRSKESFDDAQQKIIAQIMVRLNSKYGNIISVVPVKDGFSVTISNRMQQTEQAEYMCGIVDYILLLYLAESMKK